MTYKMMPLQFNRNNENIGIFDNQMLDFEKLRTDF